MKSKYFFSAALPILMLCISLTALAAPPPKPPTLEQRVAQLEALLANVSRFQDSNGYVTLRFTGMNVQVVSGSGATDGVPNGTGNVIIGYNEFRGYGQNFRTGSHMLVIGVANDYTKYGGMVVGQYNTASGWYSSVSGGSYNTASGYVSSVSGGFESIASGFGSSVSGGGNNMVTEAGTSVSGGANNTASYNYSSVSGGYENTASNYGSTVSGGRFNIASGEQSSVSGGYQNTASNWYSSVSGGLTREATGDHDWVAGSLFEDF